MADKRIIELEERLTLSDGDYFATDNTNGTCKVNAKILLDRFSDDEDAIATKASKVDLTNISITGSTNNTGSTIASGTYFYKDGTLVKAIAAIANGATLTLNTNYAIVTAGGLNDLNNALSTKQDKGYTLLGTKTDKTTLDISSAVSEGKDIIAYVNTNVFSYIFRIPSIILGSSTISFVEGSASTESYKDRCIIAINNSTIKLSSLTNDGSDVVYYSMKVYSH